MNTQPQLQRHDPPPPKAIATMAPKRHDPPTPHQPKKTWGWRLILLFALCAVAAYYLIQGMK